MNWTEARVETLKQLWQENAGSAAWIAEKMGGDISRSAVIGKVHRLGLAGRPMAKGTVTREPRQRTRQKHNYSNLGRQITADAKRQAARTAERFEPAPVVVPSIDDQAIPVEQRRTIMTLELQDCRWIVGQPGFTDYFYCGGQRAAGAPYCAGHARRARAGKAWRV